MNAYTIAKHIYTIVSSGNYDEIAARCLAAEENENDTQIFIDAKAYFAVKTVFYELATAFKCDNLDFEEVFEEYKAFDAAAYNPYEA